MNAKCRLSEGLLVVVLVASLGVAGVPMACAATDDVASASSGLEAYNERDYPCAAAKFEKAIQNSPGNVELYKYLGFAYTACAFEKEPEHRDIQKKGWDPVEAAAAKKALDALLTYYQKKGRDPRLVYYLDELFDSPILEAESFTFLRKKVKESSDNPDYWRWLAKLDYSTSNLEEGFKAARNWNLLQPGSSEAYVLMGRIFLRQCLASGEPPDAIRRVVEDNIRKVQGYVNAHPQDPAALNLLRDFQEIRGWYLRGKGEAEENRLAVERLDLEVKQCPGDPARDQAHKTVELGKEYPEYLPVEPPTYLLSFVSQPASVVSSGSVSPPSIQPMGSIRPPKLLRQVIPEYPVTERRRGSGGHVVIEIIIEPDGSVSRCRKLAGANPRFDFSAIQAVSRWKYERPYLEDSAHKGSFVSVYWIVTINFTSR